MSGAEGVVLLEMRPELRERLGLPPTSFPVRRSRLAAVMSGDRLRLDLLLDELDRFLAGRPELREGYAAAGAALAYVAGVELGRQGLHPGAAHCFEIGLALAPDNDSLRLNFALALMALGRKAEALRQLGLVMSAHPEAGADPTIWTLAGRLALETGDGRRARELLGRVAAFGPAEDSFWELLGEAEERARPPVAEVAPAGTAAIPVAKPVGIPVARLVAGARPAPAADCAKCGATPPAGARFCPQCGAALG